MINLLDYSIEEFQNYLLERNQPKFRAKQILDGYYKKLDLNLLTNIPKTLKDSLVINREIEIIQERVSKIDGTIKLLYKLYDDNVIEGVLMKYEHGNTLCVSTQVGCRMGCVFCASTKNGLIRNLSAGEIIGQVLSVNKKYGNVKDRFVTNIVLMGSGEPLDNYDNTIKFLNLARENAKISLRNISVSTCGLVEKMNELADLNLGVNLSISLHSVLQNDREKLMPIAKKYDVDSVIDAAKYYFEKTKRRVIFEYAVCDNLNMSPKIATEIARKLKGFPCHINVILLNPIKESELVAPNRKQAYKFVDDLIDLGLSATLRRQLGVDIDGACGQLRSNYLDKNGEVL